MKLKTLRKGLDWMQRFIVRSYSCPTTAASQRYERHVTCHMSHVYIFAMAKIRRIGHDHQPPFFCHGQDPKDRP